MTEIILISNRLNYSAKKQNPRKPSEAGVDLITRNTKGGTRDWVFTPLR